MTSFHILFILACILYFGVSIFLRRKAGAHAIVLVDRRNTRLYSVITSFWGPALYAVLLVYMIVPEWLSWASVSVPSAARWTGAVLAVCSLPLTFWSLHSLGRNLAGGLQVTLGFTLVTRGPYKYIRHPLYLAGTLFLSGLSLLSANAAVLLPCLTGIILMRFSVIPREELTLMETFGREFSAYRNRTGIWMPVWSGRRDRGRNKTMGEQLSGGVHEA